jgi:hypothetical protein
MPLSVDGIAFLYGWREPDNYQSDVGADQGMNSQVEAGFRREVDKAQTPQGAKFYSLKRRYRFPWRLSPVFLEQNSRTRKGQANQSARPSAWA